MILESVPLAPPDAILGLNESFNNDPNPNKINLSVGVYKDADGITPIMRSVKQAEERLLRDEKTKDYLGIQGGAAYTKAVQQLLFPEGHEVLGSGRAVTVQSPGGTAALRIAADFFAKILPKAKIWLSDPTWPNHPSIFQAAGRDVRTYPYFNAGNNDLDFPKMIAALGDIPAGDVVVLHGCCHNPTGVDPTPAQWEEIANVVAERKLLPLVDFAYQGLAEGIREDAVGLQKLVRPESEVFVASSFSKNFGLYNERVGALTAICANKDSAQPVMSQLKTCIRANYSNPPAHGAAIVSTILGDNSLRADWDADVRRIRERINGMRRLFVETLAKVGVKRDFSFISRQRGMFSYSGLNPEQVKKLRDEHAIYIVGSGRINVAGMTEKNMEALCKAIAAVL
ncbi:MAG: amino acid aminotransferase [Planctomycetaceae bacterium]